MPLSSMLPRSISSRLGTLQAPDENGIRLPVGFTSRIVARSGRNPVEGDDYKWHSAPDGGATFERDDGGWVYVSNSEMGDRQGGVLHGGGKRDGGRYHFRISYAPFEHLHATD